MTGRDDRKVELAEISDLTGWLRRICQAGPGRTSPAELAAFQTAKANLIARIEAERDTPRDTPADPRTEEE